jgi:hypothetical protein
LVNDILIRKKHTAWRAFFLLFGVSEKCFEVDF